MATSPKKHRFRNMPWWRKLAVISAVFILVVSIATAILSPSGPKVGTTSPGSAAKITDKNTHRQGSPSRSSPIATPAPGQEKENTVLDPKGPVTAAKAALEALETAQFLPRKQADAIVRSVVAPKQVENEELVLRYKGRVFAKQQLGYKSFSLAQEKSNYSFVVQLYHLDGISGNYAQVTLFAQMTWLGPPNRQDRQKPNGTYSLRTVLMQRMRDPSQSQDGSKWMLVRWMDAAKQPPNLPRGNRSAAKALKLFAPYLKGFQKL